VVWMKEGARGSSGGMPAGTLGNGEGERMDGGRGAGEL